MKLPACLHGYCSQPYLRKVFEVLSVIWIWTLRPTCLPNCSRAAVMSTRCQICLPGTPYTFYLPKKKGRRRGRTTHWKWEGKKKKDYQELLTTTLPPQFHLTSSSLSYCTFSSSPLHGLLSTFSNWDLHLNPKFAIILFPWNVFSSLSACHFLMHASKFS